jgi:RimJ/RimL family protein N-acetyltransferase
MTRADDPSTDTRVELRDVVDDDLQVFFEQQLDPEATAMAAFPARGAEAFFTHWDKILHDRDVTAKTIVCAGEVAGNIVSWTQDGKREIGYWIGKAYWDKGIATRAVTWFMNLVDDRPLYAWVARHNVASIRVLEKAGFRRDGEKEDHVIYRRDR